MYVRNINRREEESDNRFNPMIEGEEGGGRIRRDFLIIP